jgi:hypothetical protein
MHRRRLEKIKREIARARRATLKAADLEGFARRLGRRKRKGKQGGEPMWDSELPDLYPLAIPHHGGRDIAPGTQRSILDQLEEDILAWEERIDDDENDERDSSSGEEDVEVAVERDDGEAEDEDEAG